VTRVFVIQRPIARDEISFPLEPKQTGAILEYFRIVREEEGGEKIRGMNFLADRETLRSNLQQLAEKIVKEFELTDFECFRRVGEVLAGESCLLVRIAALHHDEAFRAMSEYLKQISKIDVSWQVIH
jgi:molybdopterin synthase catalytic subunit